MYGLGVINYQCLFVVLRKCYQYLSPSWGLTRFNNSITEHSPNFWFYKLLFSSEYHLSFLVTDFQFGDTLPKSDGYKTLTAVRPQILSTGLGTPKGILIWEWCWRKSWVSIPRFFITKFDATIWSIFEL